MSDELKKKILEVLQGNPCVCVSTVEGDSPKARYMVVGTDEGDLTMRSATFLDSRKVGQIGKNPKVCIVAGYNPACPNNPYVVIDAVGTVHTDSRTKNENWNDTMKAYFSGPEDDNYAVLLFKPEKVEYWTMGEFKPEVLEF